MEARNRGNHHHHRPHPHQQSLPPSLPILLPRPPPPPRFLPQHFHPEAASSSSSDNGRIIFDYERQPPPPPPGPPRVVDPVSNATTSGSSSGDHQGTNGSKKRKAPASAEKLAKEAEAKKKWGKRKIITPEEKVGIVEWHEKYGHGNKEITCRYFGQRFDSSQLRTWINTLDSLRAKIAARDAIISQNGGGRIVEEDGMEGQEMDGGEEPLWAVRGSLSAAEKLKVVIWHNSSGCNRAATVRHFGNRFTALQLKQWVDHQDVLEKQVEESKQAAMDLTNDEDEGGGANGAASGEEATKNGKSKKGRTTVPIEMKLEVLRYYENEGGRNKEGTVRHFGRQFDTTQLRQWLAQKDILEKKFLRTRPEELPEGIILRKSKKGLRQFSDENKITIVEWYEANGMSKAKTRRHFKETFAPCQLRGWIKNKEMILQRIKEAEQEREQEERERRPLKRSRGEPPLLLLASYPPGAPELEGWVVPPYIVPEPEDTEKDGGKGNGEGSGEADDHGGDGTTGGGKSSRPPRVKKPIKLRRTAREKLVILRWYEENGRNKVLTAKKFDTDRKILKEWIDRKEEIIAKAREEEKADQLAAAKAALEKLQQPIQEKEGPGPSSVPPPPPPKLRKNQKPQVVTVVPLDSDIQRWKKFISLESKLTVVEWCERHNVSNGDAVRHFNELFNADTVKRWRADKEHIIKNIGQIRPRDAPPSALSLIDQASSSAPSASGNGDPAPTSKVTKRARSPAEKLEVVDYYYAHGENKVQTQAHFKYSFDRKQLREWIKQADGLRVLAQQDNTRVFIEERSRLPPQPLSPGPTS